MPIEDLPEQYQAIYGRADLNSGSRVGNHRLSIIQDLYKKLRDHLGRDLRVLDLGCAQGFFCFSLAEIGAKVVGVDAEKKNVDFCWEIKEGYPHFEVDFFHNSAQDFVPTIQKGEFDLVLGLSVWHHISFQDGFSSTQNLIQQLHNSIDFHIYELALNSEPLYWAGAQPAHPAFHFPETAFSINVGMAETHLSQIKRPLYFSSSKKVLTGRGLSQITNLTFSPHERFPKSWEKPLAKRYFTTEDSFIKFQIRRSEIDFGTQSLEEEIRFFGEAPVEVVQFFPTVLSSELSPYSVFIEFNLISGTNLATYLESESCTNEIAKSILIEILDFVTRLEACGYFQNDLRTWNFMIDLNGGLVPIDAGAVSNQPIDVLFSKLQELSILVLAVELMSKRSLPIDLSRYFDQQVLRLAFSPLNQAPNDKVLKSPQLVKEILALGNFSPILESSNDTASVIEDLGGMLVAQRDSLLTERDSLLTERDSLLKSHSWKITSGLRSLWRRLRAVS